MQDARSLLEHLLMSAIEPIDNVDRGTLTGFDAIIDVRSPHEFAEDHIPGAINLPVLSNDERVEVGTVYKQQSTFGARRIGAGYVSQNIAKHLEYFFADQAPSSRFLIYCWRGGLRSQSMATVLSKVGWRIGLLQGGYKTWRRQVVQSLRQNAEPFNVILLDGQTGTAKTEILNRFVAAGGQAVNLEEIAAHRGSVFGAHTQIQQPSQKYFESILWHELSKRDQLSPILVEAESNRIGRCEIPKRLWQSMRSAPVISIEADQTLRSAYLVKAYSDIVSNSDAISAAINRLKPFHSKTQIEAWHELSRAQSNEYLAASLMREHYDPSYNRSRKARQTLPINVVTLAGYDHESLENAASQIISTIESRNRQ